MIDALQAGSSYVWEAGDMKDGKLLVPKDDGTFSLEDPKPVPMMKFGSITARGDLRSFKPYCLPRVKPTAIRLARA